MSDLLYRVFLEHEAELVEDVLGQLKHSTSPHYRDMEWHDLLRRVESLVAFFIISLRETPAQFIKYITEIGEERICEGYCIAEVLMALRILEENAWIIVVQNIPPQGQIRSLSRVTGTIGAAKDKMAQVYVAHLEAEEAKQNV
jgi:hypothetical protein